MGSRGQQAKEANQYPELAGRVALVTGAGGGIGRAVCELLASRGAAVCVADVDESAAERTAARATAAGSASQLVVGDASSPSDAGLMVEQAGRLGRLDVVITCAGIQRYGSVASTDQSTWDEVLRVNLGGAVTVLGAALPRLREAGDAAIVVVSSVQAFATQTGVAAYSASKAALNAVVRSLAVEEAPHGIRANGVCPGSVDTPMLRRAAAQHCDGSDEDVERLLATWGKAHPLGRLATTSEVAEVVAFLAGRRSTFVTGECIRVDGGLSAGLQVALP